jgi:D-serine deaminase-like pyridoxal phosphate-dependent protein
MQLSELPTPAALVDLDVVERNCARMSERMTRLGVRLRPHVKTHKCPELARLSVRGHFGGVTVSTLAEARAMARAGFRDLTYAFPFPIERAAEAAELARQADRLTLVLDHAQTLAALERFGFRFSVMLKVDCGSHRSGVDPADPGSVRLAQDLARSRVLDFRGILTHASHSYDARSVAEVRAVARAERDVMLAFAAELRAAGVGVSEISIGSTPTMSLADDLTGISEARPGNYVFFDAFQAALGSCTLDDAAFSVLASVVGQYPAQNKLVIDAGALALSKDPGATHLDPGCGFGAVASADGRERFPDLCVTSLSQEHGQIHGRSALDFARFPIGSRMRIVANHSCIAAAQFERYHVLRGSTVVDEWRPARGW